MVQLIYPTTTLKTTYLEGLKELQASGLNGHYPTEKAEADFDWFVEFLAEYDDVEKIPDNYVPCLRLWLVDDETFVGNVTIRRWLNEGIQDRGHIGYEIVPSHRKKGYGKKALELALDFIEEHGLMMNPVEVSCNSTNVGSRRIIEACGGVLVRQMPAKNDPEAQRLVFAIARR
jgi:predicted acetyltransferase